MTENGQVGGLAEEAAKLLDAVRATLGPGGALGPEHIATGAAECAWCPLCQLLAVLRGDRPEVSARLAEAGQAIAAAVQSVVEAASSTASASARPRRVQRIDLQD